MASSLADRSASAPVDEVIPRVSSGGPVPLDPYVPDLFTSGPALRDDLATSTSHIQDETVKEVLPFLCGRAGGFDYNEHGVPRLTRAKHAAFLRKNLGALPAPFVGADASRPWILFWSLAGLSILGEDIGPHHQALIDTARTMQNKSGGFGGGHGQTSHLATTYSVVLALALAESEEAYDVIDRRAMWKWLCSLKTPSGGFQMAYGGEVDVRGAYCAAVIISLLNLPLDLSPESPAWTPERPNLFTGLADYVRRCQTYEGGISGQPFSEGHGAYAFCALGCLSILDAPHRIIPKYLDVPRLISWLSSRQYAPEGGFSGRTNKLVDGCYSHWVGGCWPLIEAALSGPRGPEGADGGHDIPATAMPAPKQSLYSREGMIRYILCCCQDESKRGGLRDKPSKPSDAYHTCYVLSGLSSAQHEWYYEVPETSVAHVQSQDDPASSGFQSSSAKWVSSPYVDDGEQIFDERDRINTIHPVYTIPKGKVNAIIKYFTDKPGF